MILYGYSLSSASYRVRIALALKGLPVIEQNDFACVFDANGTMLRVTAVADVAHPGYTVLGWRVTDIEATVRGLTARGVVLVRSVK